MRFYFLRPSLLGLSIICELKIKGYPFKDGFSPRLKDSFDLVNLLSVVRIASVRLYFNKSGPTVLVMRN